MLRRSKEKYRHHYIDYRPEEVTEVKWVNGIENNCDAEHGHHPSLVLFLMV